ncbi:TIGR02281 family clan AA aspartic protease [Aliiroseovarius crassostreae]|uniref:retropepsin-like aspartic protease family protein n=1 Tax=Aliiroseovarius crassostreae TaxID=154981 RepID=UPI0021AEF1EB|nr:TIGR02281 family clan AA aspartic protease [Aliiroseovarius crassostreae]UWP90143.1 TIGR02281 family clan AA aspartic protease [Aliiroseovarius crassostreae]UWP93305.1 TIGR02281 family clan AA aspartic protease [Aliiroseovarius crassostreae]
MTADDLGRLAYLALLLTAVAGYFISENRFNLGQTLRHALIWVFIFIGAMAGVGLWNDIRNDISPKQSFIETSGQVVLPRAFDGHFYIQLKMNGQPIDFIVDTGASNVVLTKEDAERAGVDPSSLRYFGRALTANGTTRTAPANIARVELEGITDYGVEVWVNEGEMPQSLLGNSYLQRFDKIEIRRDQLVLTR